METYNWPYTQKKGVERKNFYTHPDSVKDIM